MKTDKFWNWLTFGICVASVTCAATGCHLVQKAAKSQQLPPMSQPTFSATGKAEVYDITPAPPLPQSVTFSLNFSTNVDLSYMFKIETSSNLIDWQFVDDTTAGEPNPTTNWQWTTAIDYNEPHRYYRITPHKP